MDIKLLKERLHIGIKERILSAAAAAPQSGTGKGGEEKGKPQLPFQELIDGLSQAAPSQQQQDERKGGGGNEASGSGARAVKASSSASAPAPAPAAAVGLKDISVHLCFICLLHLANEHGLELTNQGHLDKLSVSNKDPV